MSSRHTTSIRVNERNLPRERIIPIKFEEYDYDNSKRSSGIDETLSNHEYSYNDKSKKKDRNIVKVSKSFRRSDNNDDEYVIKIEPEQKFSKDDSTGGHYRKSLSRKHQRRTSNSSSNSNDSNNENKNKSNKSNLSYLISIENPTNPQRKHEIEVKTKIEDDSIGSKKKIEKDSNIKRKMDMNNNSNNSNAITTQPSKSILKSGSHYHQPVASSTPIPEYHRSTGYSNVIRKKPSKCARFKSWFCAPFKLCCACSPFECECSDCCYWKCFKCQQCICRCCNQNCC